MKTYKKICFAWAVLNIFLSPLSAQVQGSLQLVAQNGHSSSVGSLSVDRSGSYLATGDAKGILKLWNTRTWSLVREFASGVGSVDSLAFSADGALLASGRGDVLNPSYSIDIWTRASGQRVCELKGFASAVVSMAFNSATPNILAAIDGQTNLSLWNLSTCALIRYLRKMPDLPQRNLQGMVVAFGDDGRTLYDFSGGGAMIWNLDNLQSALIGLCGGCLVYTIPESKDVAAFVSYNSLVLWDLKSAKFIWGQKLPVAISAVDMRADGKVVATGTEQGDVSIWDRASGKMLNSISMRREKISGLRFTPGDRSLVVAYQSGDLDVLNSRDWSLAQTIRGLIIGGAQAASNMHSQFVALGGGTTFRSWDLLSGELVTNVENTVNDPYDSGGPVAFDHIGDLAVTAGHGSLRLWNTRSGQLLSTHLGHADFVTSLAFSSDDKLLVTSSWDRTVKAWTMRPFQLVRTFSGHGNYVNCIALSPNNRLLASGGGDFGAVRSGLSIEGYPVDDSIRTWDVETGEQLSILNGHEGGVEALVFTPDGKKLISGSLDHTVRVWDVNSKSQKVLRGHTEGVRSVVISPDHRILATAGDDGKLILWDMDSWKLLTSIQASSSPITSLTFINNKEILISGNELKIWSTSGTLLATLFIFKDNQNWLIVAPDGLFDGTADAMQRVSWRRENTDETVSLDSFFNDFYSPGLLADISAGVFRKAPFDVAFLIQMPSLRTMLSQKQAHLEKRGEVTLVCFEQVPGVAVQAAPGTVDLPAEINGFRVDPQDRSCKYQRELPRQASSGELLSKLQDSQAERFATPWDELPSATVNSTLHVLTVGVGEYAATSGFDALPYAMTSAKAVEQFFAEQDKHPQKPYAKVDVSPGLYDFEATRDNIRGGLSKIAKQIGKDDVVLLYLAGHGDIESGQEMFYFVPFDGRADRIRETGVSTAMLAEAVRNMPARRVVLIIDACQSGGAVEALGKIGEVKASVELRLARRQKVLTTTAQQGVGIKIIAATMPLAYAVQRRSDQSALVATLLEILGERREDAKVSEVIDSLKQRLPLASEKTVGFRQVPLISSIGLDFVLTGPSLSIP